MHPQNRKSYPIAMLSIHGLKHEKFFGEDHPVVSEIRESTPITIDITSLPFNIRITNL